RLPINILKIDKAFVDRLGQDEDQERLLNGIIKLAHDVNLATVAEGIETQEQADALQRLQAGLGQGFHYSRPASSAQIDELLMGATPVVPPRAGTGHVASPE
ncbi:MAG TPA: EAL domain-containing protein, partial [Solirubrobacteraceae bacterium]|nr:EAL domain-containing protein [Solirubrobacteraceae bacterium]